MKTLEPGGGVGVGVGAWIVEVLWTEALEKDYGGQEVGEDPAECLSLPL